MTTRSRPVIEVGALARMLAVAGLLPLVVGCAQEMTLKPDTPAPAYTTFDESGKRWWQMSFYLSWNHIGEPDWHLDVLLADQIMAPIIARAESSISLWRFHRRAAPDDHGHRFSFIFYADAETAAIIGNEVDESTLTAALLETGIVRAVRLAELDTVAARDIGASSDPAWPEALRRAWPWFIMGVSQSWLRLINEQTAKRPPPEGASPAEALDYYQGIHDDVSALWREHGQHAYLHHLNAVFGYQLLIIRETNLKRF